MARIRSLKPEFWSDVKMIKLSFAARLFYQGLWTFSMCDVGHLPDDIEQLKMNIFPCDDVDPRALLDELVNIGRVVRVVAADGVTYLHVRKLADHSRVDNRWSSRCPACSTPLREEPHTNSDEPGRAHESPSEPSRAQTDSDELPTFSRVKEGYKNSPSSAARMTESATPPAAPPRATVTPIEDRHFGRFWDAYPRKVGKGAARKAWTKAIKSGATPPDIAAGAERYRDDPKRRREDIRFTAHPATWLNAERWTDQLAEEPSVELIRRPFWEN
jgi:hypothetical protein